MRWSVILFILSFWFLVSCSSNRSRTENADDRRPSLTVWGFSCEVGSRRCKDRQVAYQARDLAENAMGATGQFRIEKPEASHRKHLRDVADMLWASGDSALLQDVADLVESDWLLYGRVLSYNQVNRQLNVELTLLERESGRRIVGIGVGERGSLPKAIADAVARLDASL